MSKITCNGCFGQFLAIIFLKGNVSTSNNSKRSSNNNLFNHQLYFEDLKNKFISRGCRAELGLWSVCTRNELLCLTN